ncbi:hypothetical protein LTR17_026689 [Elasticomyces elasticus]|nr:hypothetical protein LTR17_026689 [Elasticomyces elasticus]
MATERCYLLELPKELRLQIYEYLLRPECIHLYTYDSPTIVGLSQDEIARTRVYHQFTSDDPPMDLHPHILSVCHQVYDEALASLHKPYTLQIEPSCGGSFHQDLATGKTVLRIFDATRLCNVRILPTLRIRLCTGYTTGIEDIAHSTFFATLLRAVSVVKKLELRTSVGWEEEEEVDDDTSEEQKYLSNLEALVKIWGDLKLKTDMHVRFEYDEDWISWCKEKGGEWHDGPDSNPGSDYGVSGRPIRLFKAVKAAFV